MQEPLLLGRRTKMRRRGGFNVRYPFFLCSLFCFFFLCCCCSDDEVFWCFIARRRRWASSVQVNQRAAVGRRRLGGNVDVHILQTRTRTQSQHSLTLGRANKIGFNFGILLTAMGNATVCTRVVFMFAGYRSRPTACVITCRTETGIPGVSSLQLFFRTLSWRACP